MARVDFYHLTRDSAEAALAMLAGKVLGAGQRMMVVSADPAQREAVSRSLWEAPGFLANGLVGNDGAGGEDDARQPVLIGDTAQAPNDASIVALADGNWRDEALSFDRALLLFSESTINDARACWKALGQKADVERHYWSQDESGRWREGP